MTNLDDDDDLHQVVGKLAEDAGHHGEVLQVIVGLEQCVALRINIRGKRAKHNKLAQVNEASVEHKGHCLHIRRPCHILPMCLPLLDAQHCRTPLNWSGMQSV